VPVYRGAKLLRCQITAVPNDILNQSGKVLFSMLCYRSYRLARLDGVKTVAILIGTLLAPIFYNNFGYYSNIGTRIGLSVSALLYLFFMVKEPILKQHNPDNLKSNDG
jgi:hypothetical protein